MGSTRTNENMCALTEMVEWEGVGRMAKHSEDKITHVKKEKKKNKKEKKYKYRMNE